MPKVSVIVPVYNTEEYLGKCLDSLVNQTLKDIEIIVINDGSKDRSGEIIEKYVKENPEKIVYIKQENEGGICPPRNRGLERATGEYIAFLDSDDWIDVSAYERMYEKAKSKDFDIVMCETYAVYSNKNVYISCGVETDTRDIKGNMNNLYAVIWNKIYKRELLEKIKFREDVWFEDVEFLYRLYPNIKSIGVVKKPFCYYLQRQGSMTYTYNEKIYRIIDNFESVFEYYKSNGIFEEYYNELEYAYLRYSFATFIKRMAKTKDKKVFDQGVEYAIKKVRETFPNYKKNKYLKGIKGRYLKYFNKFIAMLIYCKEKDRMN